MSTDPVRASRARAARSAGVAKRIGYSLFLGAIVVFAVGLLTEFSGTVSAVIVACLVVGSIVLLPGIIVGYGVRVAEREDRERGV